MVWVCFGAVIFVCHLGWFGLLCGFFCLVVWGFFGRGAVVAVCGVGWLVGFVWDFFGVFFGDSDFFTQQIVWRQHCFIPVTVLVTVTCVEDVHISDLI